MAPSPDPLLTVETFSPNNGTCFRVEHGAETPVVEMELIEVNALPVTKNAPPLKREPFSLIFRGLGGFAFQQGLYRLQHEKLGVLEIFLVPVGKDEKGIFLEAIFN